MDTMQIMTPSDWKDYFYSLRPDDSEPVEMTLAMSVEQADALLRDAFEGRAG